MVNRNKAMLREKAFSFRDGIGKQWFHFAPITFAAAESGRAVDDIDSSCEVSGDGCRVQLMIDQHGGQTLVRRDAIEGKSRRGPKSGGAALGQVLPPLPIPGNFVL